MQQQSRAAPGAPGPDTRRSAPRRGVQPRRRTWGRAAPDKPLPGPRCPEPVGPQPTAYLESTENTALLKFSRLPPQRTTRTLSCTIFTQTQEPPSTGRITNFLHRPTGVSFSPPAVRLGFSSSETLWLGATPTPPSLVWALSERLLKKV